MKNDAGIALNEGRVANPAQIVLNSNRWHESFDVLWIEHEKIE
jgi:hypothetical protein